MATEPREDCRTCHGYGQTDHECKPVLIDRDAAIAAIEGLWAFPVHEREGQAALVREVKRQAIAAILKLEDTERLMREVSSGLQLGED